MQVAQTRELLHLSGGPWETPDEDDSARVFRGVKPKFRQDVTDFRADSGKKWLVLRN